MFFSFGIVLVINGLLCLLNKVYLNEDKENIFLLNLSQFQGWIGLSICLWGIWGLIYACLELQKLSTAVLYWIDILLGGGLNAFGGGLLGFSMIQKLTLSQVPQAAQAEADRLRLRLVHLQIYAAYILLVIGSWLILNSFFYQPVT